ncbi:alpha/beta fold hydrolase [Microbacterium sp. RD1]|uniref:alpha/beta fold hydrolase n=1 Tax=Microbacterium sp. RD1 TaxID=3457313 RepID=UPI003FA5A752
MTSFLLVHGAFRGAWWWGRVAERLRAEGHDVHAPTLPGLGERASELSADQNLDTYASDILDLLHRHDLRDVVLVGHSFGGYPISAAADREPERIARLVYLDAAVPVDGQSAVGDSAATAQSWLARAGDDGWSVPPMPVEMVEVRRPSDREAVQARLTRMPLAPFVQRLRLTGGIDRIPHRQFVFATGWAATPYRGQFDRLRSDPAWSVTSVDAGHELMLDAPDRVVDILLSAEGLPGR